MKLQKFDWAVTTMLLTGVVGILYFTRTLNWHERSLVCFFIFLFVHGLSFLAKDSTSQKKIRIINMLFIVITALFIAMYELFF